MKKVLFGLAFTVALPLLAQQKPVYLDVTKPIEERVEDALKRLTLEEKVAMVHAQSKFSSAGVPRLGIPENWMTDGPHGIRPEVLWDEWDQAGWTNDSCVAYPALTCLAATWNPICPCFTEKVSVKRRVIATRMFFWDLVSTFTVLR